MHSFVNENVSFHSVYKPVVSSFRMGTVFLSPHDFGRQFGDPHMTDDNEYAKVTIAWTVRTPRGLVEIGDYCLNNENTMSIRATNKKSVLWIIQWLKGHGANCSFDL